MVSRAETGPDVNQFGGRVTGQCETAFDGRRIMLLLLLLGFNVHILGTAKMDPDHRKSVDQHGSNADIEHVSLHRVLLIVTALCVQCVCGTAASLWVSCAASNDKPLVPATSCLSQ